MGYKNIVLLGKDGRRLATFNRRKVRGFAVDGQPIVIHGEGFKRIGIDDPATAEAAGDAGPSEEAVDAAVAEEVAEELAAEGAGEYQYKKSSGGCLSGRPPPNFFQVVPQCPFCRSYNGNVDFCRIGGPASGPMCVACIDPPGNGARQ